MKGVLKSAAIGGAIGGICAAATTVRSSKLDPIKDVNTKEIRTE